MEIQAFLSKVSGAHRAYNDVRSLYAVEVSPDFNALGLLRPSEMDLSRTLAWMLDPKESHSQGAAFLFEFLNRFKIPHDDSPKARVRVEETVPEGRLDISIVLLDGRKIVIENKPFASDQPRQLERYLGHVGPLGRVIYLPGSVREASESSIKEIHRISGLADGRLIESSWIELLPFFEACGNASRSPRVRSFIEEIPRYIRAEFQGVTDLTETNNVIDQIKASSENIETAFLVSNAVDGMRKRLITDLNDQICAQLPSGWISKEKLQSGRESYIFVHYPDLRVRFYVGFDKSNYAEFSHGLQWFPGTKRPSRSVVDGALVRAGFSEQTAANYHKDFPLWNWGDEADQVGLPSRWFLTPQPWQDIANGTASRRILEAAQRYLPVAKELDLVVPA